MNYYIDLIEKSIDYIEKNILEEISLAIVSKQLNLSQYHFDRLFNIIVGTSFKQYVLARKLTLASDKLSNSTDTILQIALEFGFQYPETFSRAFKKQFGISPKVFREKRSQINKINKALVIPRNLVNYNGGVTLKADYVQLDNITLQGMSMIVDVYNAGFEAELEELGKKFLNETCKSKHLDQDKFYNLVNCHGAGNSTYTVYFGKEVLIDKECTELTERIISKGRYASFLYQGEMSNVRTTFEDDLFRWIALKEIKLKPIGIGMISIYDKEYYEKSMLRILVPVYDF